MIITIRFSSKSKWKKLSIDPFINTYRLYRAILVTKLFTCFGSSTPLASTNSPLSVSDKGKSRKAPRIHRIY